MLTFSSLSLAALLCFASHKYFGIGAGRWSMLRLPCDDLADHFWLYIWRFRPKRSNKYT